MNKIATTALLSLFSILPLSCSSDFEQYYQVTRLRLLGIKAERPVLLPGESTTLQAITYVPPSVTTPTTYEWTWCPFRTVARNQYNCPISHQQLIDIVKEKAGSTVPIEKYLPDFSLGTGESATFAYPGPKFAVTYLCQMALKVAEEAGAKIGVAVPTLDCNSDYQVSVRLVVRNGDQEIVAMKKVGLSLGTLEINQNPDVVGLQIRPADLQEADQLRAKGASWIPVTNDLQNMWYTLPEGQETPIVAGGRFEMRSVVDEQSVERWTPPKKYGSEETPQPEKEAIKFSWFVSQADKLEFKQSLVYREGKTDLTEVSNVIWEPQCTYQLKDASPPSCDPITVWSFVRDGRLGLDWTARSFKIVSKMDKK